MKRKKNADWSAIGLRATILHAAPKDAAAARDRASNEYLSPEYRKAVERLLPELAAADRRAVA